MIRLLKADLYKMFRMPSFWVTTLIAWAYSAFFNGAWFYSTLRDAKHIYEVTGSVMDLKSLIPEWAVLSINFSVTFLAVFVIIFAAAEFSTGTIKNVATKGFMREEIYFSKFICSIIAALISAAGSFGLTYAAGAIVIGDQAPTAWDIPENFVRNIFITFLITIVYVAFSLMIAFLFRSTGSSIGTFFVYFTVFEVLIFSKILPAILRPVVGEVDFQKYSMGGCLSFKYDDLMTRGLTVAFIYIIVCTLIGLFTFRKRDIN